MPSIRNFQSSDLSSIMSIWEKASALAHPFLPAEFQDQVRKDIPQLYLPNADTWVVIANSNVVGFIALIENEIGAIFLDPEHHGKKLGKLMIDKALVLHDELEVEVFEKNAIGRTFYQKCGFSQIESKVHPSTNEPLLRLKLSKES